jgi:hypothetical protein
VGTGEEYLFDIGLLPSHGINMVFVRVGGTSGCLSTFDLVVAVLALGVIGNFGVRPLELGLSTGTEGGDELDTALVESQRMAEVYNGIVRAGEWQVFGNQSDGLHGVPTWRCECEIGNRSWGSNYIPHAKELDPYVDRKGSLELHAQLQTLFVIPRVHGIRERQLFEVAWREKPDFLEHASEGTSCESATRESKNTDLIPDVI